MLRPMSQSAFPHCVFSENQRRQRYTVPRYLHRSTSFRMPQSESRQRHHAHTVTRDFAREYNRYQDAPKRHAPGIE